MSLATPASKQTDVRSLYEGLQRPLPAGGLDFQLDLIRRGTTTLELIGRAETISWSDGEISTAASSSSTDSSSGGDPQAGALTAQVVLRDPSPLSMGVGLGQLMRLRVGWAGRPREVWTMRAGRPDAGDGTLTVALADPLARLDRDKLDWSFRAAKKTGRPKGYLCHEIAAIVCRRVGVTPGVLARGRNHIKKLEHDDTTALDIIVEAYKAEAEKNFRRFVIRMNAGRLDCVPFQRPQTLYVIEDQDLLGVPTVSQTGKDDPVTVLHARGRLGKNSKAKTLRHTELVRAVVDRYGYVAQDKDFGRVKDLTDLREHAQAELARQLKVTRTVTLVLPGVPWIRRGSQLRWLTDTPGFSGRSRDLRDRSMLWVTAAEHNLTGSDYTTTVTCEQTDSYFAAFEALDKQRREAAHKAKAGGDEIKAKP